MLNRHGNRDKVVEINRAGVEIARAAFGGREGWVLGDIGPFGGLMKPYGEFTEDEVRDAFAEQARALSMPAPTRSSSRRRPRSRNCCSP